MNHATTMPQSDRFFSPWCLGAPLYMPAYRRDLIEIANGDKLPDLRSVIFCTEDAVSSHELDSSIRHLGLCLQGFRAQHNRFRFIRARNPDILKRLLDLPHIEKIDGFVLPKFNSTVFDAYMDQLSGTAFKIMPTLETKDVFDIQAMQALRDAFISSGLAAQILMLRIGGNDLMNLLGIRRPRGFTLYDTPLGAIIAQLVSVFKPYQFALSAPVFEYLDDLATLEKELSYDLAYGLSGKTAIHPSQIPCIEAAYQVEQADIEMALKLLDTDSPAVFKMHNAMCEVATHQKWGHDILARHRYYGLKNSPGYHDYTEISV